VREREGKRRGAADHLALVVVLGAVARALELVLRLVPGHDAAEVRAHRVDAVVLDGAVILHDDVRGVTLLLFRRIRGEETFAFRQRRIRRANRRRRNRRARNEGKNQKRDSCSPNAFSADCLLRALPPNASIACQLASSSRARTLRFGETPSDRSVPYPRLGGGYAAIDIAIRLGRAGGGARETPRAPGAAAVDSVGRRDTYLEALGQGVVAGEVGLEPHLGLDVRAGGVLGRLARAAAAAAAMEEGGGDVSVASSEGFVDAARPNRAIGARDREGPPSWKKSKRA